MRNHKFLLILFLLLISMAKTNSASAAKKQIWIYTSIYKEFADPLKKAFEEKNPDIEAQIFQGGSEKLQSKVEAELLAHQLQADVILSSDPFWAHDLNTRGLVNAPKAKIGDDTNYFSLMVLIVAKDLDKAARPHTFNDLTKPDFKNKVQMGSPLESGTMFAIVAYLSRKYGWVFFKKLRENEIAANGGNSTVIQKVESGEKKVGIVLLENALASIKRGSPIDIIYPEDGSIAIPSVQVVMKESKQPEAAQKFAAFVLTKEGQEVLRSGYMYSVRQDVKAPEGSKPLKEVTKNSTAWTTQTIGDVAKEASSIKKQFSNIVLQ